MALKLPDSAVPMGDFPVAKAVDIDFDDGENLQEKMDNGKLGGGAVDLTDIENRLDTLETKDTTIENRVTINETNITGLQEQIDNLDIPEDVDLTEINNKLAQLENNIYIDQLENSKMTYYKITCGTDNNFYKLLVTDSYGGSLLIIGSVQKIYTSYQSFKVVRLTNGNWESYDPFNTIKNKLLNVHYDGSYIYLTIEKYSFVYLEGVFNSVEKIDSLPTGVTELPIFDLTQKTTLTEVNTKITALETKDTTIENRLTTLEGNTNDLFQSVSDGKTLVANAITDKGVSTSPSATFATMASNISKISGATVGYKSESKSDTIAVRSGSTGTKSITFSNTVLGITTLEYDIDVSYITKQSFSVSGNTVTINIGLSSSYGTDSSYNPIICYVTANVRA